MARPLYLSLGLGLAALVGLPRASHPCSPPPNIWTIADSSAPEGGQIAPEGPFGLHGKALYGYGYGLAHALNVTVHCAGEEVAGRVEVEGESTAFWWPDQPLTVGDECQIEAHINNEEALWGDPEHEHYEYSYTVHVREPSALRAPTVREASAATKIHEERICGPNDPIDSCGGCWSENIRQELRIQFEATLERPDVPDAGAYVGQLRVAPTVAELANDRHTASAYLWQQDSLSFKMNLGLHSAWSGDEVCYEARWGRLGEEPVASPAQCVALDATVQLPGGGEDAGPPTEDGGTEDAGPPTEDGGVEADARVQVDGEPPGPPDEDGWIPPEPNDGGPPRADLGSVSPDWDGGSSGSQMDSGVGAEVDGAFDGGNEETVHGGGGSDGCSALPGGPPAAFWLLLGLPLLRRRRSPAASSR